MQALADDAGQFGVGHGPGRARGGEYAYDLYFDVPEKATSGDEVVTVGEGGDEQLQVVITASSVENMAGATLDMSRDLLNPGMVITNPNRPPMMPGPGSPTIDLPDPSELTGTVEERVRYVLERHINPSIAAHGGTAELVAVWASERSHFDAAVRVCAPVLRRRGAGPPEARSARPTVQVTWDDRSGEVPAPDPGAPWGPLLAAVAGVPELPRVPAGAATVASIAFWLGDPNQNRSAI